MGSLLKKYPFPGDAAARRAAAIKTVLAGDLACSDFNRTGYKGLLNPDGGPTPLLQGMRAFALKVLGNDVDDISITSKLWCRHGPGTTTDISKRFRSSYYKYVRWPYECTESAFAHAKELISCDPRWFGALENSYREQFEIPKWEIIDHDHMFRRVIRIVKGNRITTVPKDGRKDRPIAIEPSINMVLQLGVDGYIRKRLKRWGIDLDSQVKNQTLARSGSVSHGCERSATIDLASASDTISLRICKLILPEKWYRYLCDLRSPFGELPDRTSLRFSKMSTMGNGSTFALESLIFASVVYAVATGVCHRYPRNKIAIFGDDLIVPEVMAEAVVEALRRCGFSTNQDKSFLEGDVKESCGTDWVNGFNVRPVFVKKSPEFVDEVFTHRNLLFRWLSNTIGLDPVDSQLMTRFRSWIPTKFRTLLGPISDEEFAGYLHTYTVPKGAHKHSKYFYTSIARSMGTAPGGKDFLFRKLMHQLRPSSYRPKSFNHDFGSSNGSVFDVEDPFKGRRFTKVRTTTHWELEYLSTDVTSAERKEIEDEANLLFRIRYGAWEVSPYDFSMPRLEQALRGFYDQPEQPTE
jgi:hypothetical protein